MQKKKWPWLDSNGDKVSKKRTTQLLFTTFDLCVLWFYKDLKNCGKPEGVRQNSVTHTAVPNLVGQRRTCFNWNNPAWKTDVMQLSKELWHSNITTTAVHPHDSHHFWRPHTIIAACRSRHHVNCGLLLNCGLWVTSELKRSALPLSKQRGRIWNIKEVPL